jgi:hypothetical protein
MITGHSPYRAGGLFELLQQQQERRFEPLRRHAPGAPAELEEIVARCLEPSRRKRIRSMEILDRKLAALDWVEDALPVPAPAPEQDELIRAAPEPAAKGPPVESGTEVVSSDDPVHGGLEQLRHLRERQARAAARVRRRTASAPARAANRARSRAVQRKRRIGGRVAAVVAVIALAVGVEIAAVTLAGSGTDKPAEESAAAAQGADIPASDDPAQQARDLADWLREHSR